MPTRRDAVLVGTRIVLAVAWAGVIGWDVAGSLSNHPHQLTSRERRQLVTILPQGWGFFTRNPQEALPYFYVRNGGSWSRVGVPNASPHNWLGFKKDTRIQSIEFAGLTAQMPKRVWSRCAVPVNDCAAAREPAVREVLNRALQPTVCGALLVERRPPVPWAWARIKQPIYIPSEVAVVQVRCAHERRDS